MNPMINTYSLLKKTSETLEKMRLKVLSPYGLNCNEYGILEILHQKGCQNINQLGDEILVTSSSMTYLIDRLEEKGWIKREKSPVDRRSILVHITKEGQELVDVVLPKHQTKMDKYFSCLSNNETSEMNQFLNKINKNMETT